MRGTPRSVRLGFRHQMICCWSRMCSSLSRPARGSMWSSTMKAVANFFDDQVDAGRRPESFGRLWLHTHPGNSPEPSITDEETFSRVFGRSDWAVMFILARGGQTYARLRYNVGPGAEFKLPVEVDFSRPFNGTTFEAWQDEYLVNVRLPPEEPPKKPPPRHDLVPRSNDDPFIDDWRREAWEDYLD